MPIFARVRSAASGQHVEDRRGSYAEQANELDKAMAAVAGGSKLQAVINVAGTGSGSIMPTA